MVFNLIRIGQMRKTPQDRREDFDDVYDFEHRVLGRDFSFGPSQRRSLIRRAAAANAG